MCKGKIKRLLVSDSLSVSCVSLGITTYVNTNFINVTVVHKSGSKKPKIAFGFVAKGLLLTSSFIMGFAPAIPTMAKADVNSISNKVLVSTVSMGSTSTYSAVYDVFAERIGMLSNMFQYEKEKDKVYNTSYLNSLYYELSKLENGIDAVGVPSDVSKLVDALEKAKKAIYFDEEWFGCSLTGEDAGMKQLVEKQLNITLDKIVNPREIVEIQSSPTSGVGRVVYVAPRGETQAVYDKPSSGLTPITVKYGKHSYLSNNQKEYDLVMKVVEDTLNFEGKTGKAYKESLDKWKNDEKFRKRAMIKYGREGITDEDKAFELYKIESACGSARIYNGNSDGKSINSAYELLQFGIGDCTASAMVNLAVMDAMGYNAKTVGSKAQNHEWAMVEISSKWYHLYGAGLESKSATIYEFVTTPDTFNNAK